MKSLVKRLARGVVVVVLMGSLMVPVVPVSAEGELVQHTVQRGENLFRIAIWYGVSQRSILAANGLTNPDYVREGQVLVIPAGAGEMAPTPQQIVAAPSVAVALAPETVTPASPPEQPADQQSALSGKERLHTIQPGESLFWIALQYGVSVTAIVQANSLYSADVIIAGQTLVIPDGSGAGGGVYGRAGTSAGPSLQPLVSTPVGYSVILSSQDAQQVDFSVASWFRLTHYCLPGTMASGRTVYLGAVAADKSIFPLGTRLLIEGYGFFTVEDRFGWDARQPRLGVWVPTCYEAIQRGVQFRRVFVVVPR